MKKQTQTTVETSRYNLIDAIRGITMLSMILYHSCFDYFVMFGVNKAFPSYNLSFIWQQSICMSFILISGFVSVYSRNNFKKGITLNLYGFLITFVSIVFFDEAHILFGVLNFLGCATILIIPINKLYKTLETKKNTVTVHFIGLIGDILFFTFTRHLSSGYFGTRHHIIFKFPDALYKIYSLYPLGLPTSNFYSSDYFPIFPWIFLFVMGYHLNFILTVSANFNIIATKKLPFLSNFGKKSLLVYLLHQPICYVICFIIFKIKS